MGKRQPTVNPYRPTCRIHILIPENVNYAVNDFVAFSGEGKSEYISKCIENQPPVPSFSCTTTDIEGILDFLLDISGYINSLGWGVQTSGRVTDDQIETISYTQRDINAAYCELYKKIKGEREKTVSMATLYARKQIEKTMENKKGNEKIMQSDGSPLTQIIIKVPESVGTMVETNAKRLQCSKSVYITNCIMNQPVVKTFEYTFEDLSEVYERIQDLHKGICTRCRSLLDTGVIIARDITYLTKMQNELMDVLGQMKEKYAALHRRYRTIAARIVDEWKQKELAAEVKGKVSKRV